MELRFEEGERQAVTARLGLAENASDEDLQTRLAAWLAEDPNATPATSSSNNDGGENGGGTGDGGGTETNASVDDLEGDDVVVIDALSLRRYQERDRVAAQIEARNRIRDRDELIAEAVHDGKIGPGRAQHYADRYDSDPEGTTRLLARLQPNTIPLEERGQNADPSDADDTSAYPTEWVPEVAAAASGERRNRVTRD